MLSSWAKDHRASHGLSIVFQLSYSQLQSVNAAKGVTVLRVIVKESLAACERDCGVTHALRLSRLVQHSYIVDWEHTFF